MCKRLLSAALCAVMILLALPDSASANSAEPPSLVIVVNGAPNDLAIEVEVDNKLETASKKVVAWETYYAFYCYGSVPSALHVRTGEESYTIQFDKPDMFSEQYNVTFTLDHATRTLSEGTLPFRSAMLIALRVVLTLLIEGALFFAFGFRKKSSWLLFLIVNFATQGALNWVLLSTDTIFSNAAYLMIPLVALEILVLALEIPLLTCMITEHKAWRRALFTVTANIVSFVAGGFMITMLPV